MVQNLACLKFRQIAVLGEADCALAVQKVLYFGSVLLRAYFRDLKEGRTMATHHIGGPSNVIQFRLARRAILGGIRTTAKPQNPDGDGKSERLSKADFGECWYHEAAIRDDDPDRKQ
jgi:Protein of unknown function (DUF2735)